MTFILMALGILKHHPAPIADVTADSVEMEAIFVPAGVEGPIVAIPGDEPVF